LEFDDFLTDSFD